jgi:hypothetical protein
MKYEKYLAENDIPEEDAAGFKLSPQQLKNLKVYVLDMEGSTRHILMKRALTKLNSYKPLNADEADVIKEFCLDVLSGSPVKFKALMG